MAYADGLNGLELSSTPSSYSRNYDNDRSKNRANQFFDSVIDGAINTAGVAVGATLLCYGADGLATTVFPPAAALAPFCTSIPGLFVGAKGAQLSVQGAKVVLKGAIEIVK
ncbi:hypothetical protein VB712_07955 [Spirulina sp. CCNP1310]|nr:hypothetical protein [Spirulina sp. CCNP1310]